MWGVQRRDPFLHHAEIGQPEHADIAIAPRLGREPFDRIINVLDLPGTLTLIEPFGFARPAHVGNNVHVTSADVKVKIAGFHVPPYSARTNEHKSLRGRCVFCGLILKSLSCLVPAAWMLQASCIMSWPRGILRQTIFRDDSDRDDFVVRLGALAKAGAFHVYSL